MDRKKKLLYPAGILIILCQLLACIFDPIGEKKEPTFQIINRTNLTITSSRGLYRVGFVASPSVRGIPPFTDYHYMLNSYKEITFTSCGYVISRETPEDGGVIVLKYPEGYMWPDNEE
ncbi:hypothetical protein KAR48_12700 [bacterium]|nr:hypothetical protein [bacterium]